MEEQKLHSYDQLIDSLKESGIIGKGESLAPALFAEADKIYNGYSDRISAKKVTGESGKEYSDIFDDNGHQVVDLVQEGGAMWGIALVGYTYILEKAGLRFNSLAGTSAGAINTMCLAAIPDSVYGESQDNHAAGTKSKILAEIIANHDYSDFVDRKKGIMRTILLSYLKKKGNLLLWLFLSFLWIVFSTCFYFLLSGLFMKDTISWETRLYLYLAGTILAFLPFVVLILILKGVLGEKFGLNPGNVPRDFIRTILKCNGIETTEDLYNRINRYTILGMIRKGEALVKNDDKIKKRVVLISSNLTHGRIVKFPERAIDYFHDMKMVDPSIYVRASMSIPLFFECVSLADLGDPAQNKNVKMKARFVDGGMLSNFPIREFHNDKIKTPRFPTFGVRLGVSRRKKFSSHINFRSYILSFISTFRGFYDNDYIDSNSEVGKLVSEIETGNISSLNFAMSHRDKITLFKNGARAACEFLGKFDWGEYKKIREGLYEKNIANA